MHAVQLLGYGGLDRLSYRTDIPVPEPGAGELRIRVIAAGMNNTDINTRTGWYQSSVSDGTTADGGEAGFGVSSGGMGDWSGDVTFPRIQGADCSGIVDRVGDGVDPARIGQRVICDPYFRDEGDATGLETVRFLGAEVDGAFAQFVTVAACNALSVAEDTGLSHEQLATVPCSGGTAMNMLLMAGVGVGDRLLVTGASGGVGSFLLQLGKWLGAEVVGVSAKSKQKDVQGLGADAVVDREADDFVTAALAAGSGGPFSVVADVVGGARFPDLLAVLRRGGRYVTAGAVAGPVVSLDLRTLYLKSLAFFGSSAFRRDAMPTLVKALESGAVVPAVACTWPLEKIREAQLAFLSRNHVGSMVLLPPTVSGGT